MLKDKEFWKIHLKWGVIVGIMLVGIEILKMFARKVDYSASQLLDLAMIIGFIIVLYHGVKEFKEVYPERLSFAKAFLSCIVMSVIGAVILFGYDMLHYSVFEKDGLQQKYAVALDKYKHKRLARMNIHRSRQKRIGHLDFTCRKSTDSAIVQREYFKRFMRKQLNISISAFGIFKPPS